MSDYTKTRLGGELTTAIAAPIDQVWQLVTDITRIGEFSPETFAAQWLGGATGPSVGAKFRGHVKRNGIGPVYWSYCKVSQCAPPASNGLAWFEFGVGRPGGDAINTWGYRLASATGGTEVTEYFQLTDRWFNSVYWFLLGRLRGKTNETGMRETLNRMKAVLERADPASS